MTTYPINGPWHGRLAIIPRPRGGEWLAGDVKNWQQSGLDVIVSLLTTGENMDLDLQQEPELVSARGLKYLSFPIPDRSTPISSRETGEFIKRVEKLLLEGKSVGIHCRQGVGRSALIAAGVLVESGVGVDAAFEQVEAARGCPVPDTVEQRQWLESFAHRKEQYVY